MDEHAYYDLKVLEHLEETPNVTQRMVSDKLGVSVKLAHSVMRGLLQRGWIHATRRDGRSLSYFLTPQGISEKVRLTYEFLRFSQQFFQGARKRSSEVCRDLAHAGVRRLAFLGCGELAEIAYLGVTEHGLRLAAVFDDERAGETFMGVVVKPVADLAKPRSARARDFFERVLITAYDPSHPMREHYVPDGIDLDERFVWVFDHDQMVGDVARRAPKVPQPEDGHA